MKLGRKRGKKQENAGISTQGEMGDTCWGVETSTGQVKQIRV
jgi:hypothetical protein